MLVPGAVASAVERARWGPFTEGGDLAEQAALLLRGIVQDHPFADGNKRTAFEAADTFLRRNGWRIEAETGEIVRFMLACASGRMDLEEMTGWIRGRLRKV